MKKHALGALFLGLMACGGGGGSDTTVVVTGDAGGTDGPDIGACNPLTQTGCNAGEKCTWINDQDDPPIGHVGCAPEAAAPKAIGEACTAPPAGPMGYDDCAKGAVCLSGECKQICDINGGTPVCDENHSCTRYADFFESGGNAVAGVCDPGCDPLSQKLKVGDVDACGSPDPTAPTSGCYGFDEYSCAPVSAQVLTLTDRMMPRTDGAGNPYLNGCAPGFIPLFYAETGSTMTLCTGICAALEIDNTTAHMNNNQGDLTVLGKDPTGAAPVAEGASCKANHRGSSLNSSCRFMWPFLEDDAGMLPAAFEANYVDTIGVCFDYTKFTYDDDGNTMTPNVAEPNCATLPPRSAQTTGDADDAADWGCQKRANSQFTADAKGRETRRNGLIILPKRAPMQIVRHSFN